jgi:hypothetical protein
LVNPPKVQELDHSEDLHTGEQSISIAALFLANFGLK